MSCLEKKLLKHCNQFTVMKPYEARLFSGSTRDLEMERQVLLIPVIFLSNLAQEHNRYQQKYNSLNSDAKLKKKKFCV